MATHQIVILGASYAGLNVAHGLLKALDGLERQTGKSYKVTLLANATHFWWSVGAPRAMLKPYPESNDDSFIPVIKGLEQYPDTRVAFIHAQITGLDATTRQVCYKTMDDQQTISGVEERLPFDTLLVALGSTGPSPLYALQGSHIPTLKAYEDVQTRLPSAASVLIVGGGATGVETAGELGEMHGLGTTAVKDLTILSGGKRLLPALRPAIGQRAQETLEGLGVKVEHNIRMTSSKRVNGKEEVTLSDGSTRMVDLLLVGTGRIPATSCLPANLLDETKRVVVDEKMRIPSIPGAYAVGDIVSNSPGGIVTIMTAGPATTNNILAELSGGQKATMKDWKPLTTKEMQMVPIGRNAAVGAAFGWWLPSIVVRLYKGRNFMFPVAMKTVMGTA